MSELRLWQEGESILDAVRRIAADPSTGSDLPDEPPRDPSKISWSAGSLDGVSTHHQLVSESTQDGGAGRLRRRRSERPDPVDQIYARLLALARGSHGREMVALYRLALDPDILRYVDPILGRIVADPSLWPGLAPHARWLASEARHRGPVKLAIALLGVCGDQGDLKLIKAFAAHDEFTLFCSVAIKNLVKDPVDALWAVAQMADGWGKIQAVERLAPLTGERSDIRTWLLIAGCANSVMNEYLAYVCATAGGLADALCGDVDDPLLDGACTIVSALCVGGPAQDLGDYAEGAIAVDRLLALLEYRCTTLSRLDTVVVVRRRLQSDITAGGAPENSAGPGLRAVTEGEARQIEHGWSDGLRTRLVAACDGLISGAEWPDRVRAAFGEGDRRDEWLAWTIAPAVGVDLWEVAFAQLHERPLDGGRVFRVVRVRDRERQERVLAWAEANIPLELVSTGPQNHMFPEEGIRAANDALTYVVQEMRDGRLYSEPLVAAAIRSPVIQTRNQGLNAVQARPRGSWGTAVEAALAQSAADDPVEKVRARVEALLEADR